MAADTIIRRLLDNAQKLGSQPALYHKLNGTWTPITWQEYADQVRQVARGFMALGFQPGQVVTILANNRVGWVVSDLAAMAAGGVAAGIYQTCTAEQVAYIVHHAESPICVVENVKQLEKLAERISELPHLKAAVVMEGSVPEAYRAWAMSWSDLLSQSHKVSPNQLTSRIEALEPSGLATLIYTSGTTGVPKGVMLSHQNLTFTADSLIETMPHKDNQVGLSYLPLSHIAEQMLTLHLPISMKVTVYFAESLEKLKENLAEVRPTIFFGVPRVWEKFEAALIGKFREATGLKAFFLSFARATGLAVHKHLETGKPLSGLLALRYAIANKLVFGKLKAALGLDRTVFFISGAAPISRTTLEFFRGLDVCIREVYGQSEDSGPTTLNTLSQTRLGTVGPVIPGVTVRIAEDGEILVKGGNVFLGYYKDPVSTAETLVDGWLHSGDIGQFDDQGFLRITDRKKDLLITAGGKNVAPLHLEGQLKTIPLVSQAVVIGDRQKYLAALITLKEEGCKSWCQENNIPFTDLTTLSDLPLFRDYMQSQVDRINEQLASYESIKRFVLLPEEFSQERDELTPTMKIKRKVINERYKSHIASLYQ